MSGQMSKERIAELRQRMKDSTIDDRWVSRDAMEDAIDVAEGFMRERDEARAALNEIRHSGYNTHPTAIWMQKVAACAMTHGSFKHPGKLEDARPAPADVVTVPREELAKIRERVAWISCQLQVGYSAAIAARELADLLDAPCLDALRSSAQGEGGAG